MVRFLLHNAKNNTLFAALLLEGVSPNIDKLNKLTILDLSMNDLGKVPEAIMSLINLQQLCLNDTGIDYVPANIGRLSNLRILELRDNGLRELPKSIRRLTNLQRLDVSDNNLSQLVGTPLLFSLNLYFFFSCFYRQRFVSLMET
jgi:Leucine-rich repeat (LRR) protein